MKTPAISTNLQIYVEKTPEQADSFLLLLFWLAIFLVVKGYALTAVLWTICAPDVWDNT